jgi:hypothetical protein
MENPQVREVDMNFEVRERSNDLPRDREAQIRLLLHNLNNALMIIGSNCELLLASLDVEDLRNKQAQRIQNATRQAILIVNDQSLALAGSESH